MVPKREYDPRHAAQRRIAAAIIACIAVILIAAGAIYVIVRYPNLGVHNPAAAASSPAVCRFYAKNVTVTVSGAANCVPILQTLADDTDTMWNSTTLTMGQQFAQLGKGAAVVRVYEAGNKPFAGSIADWFQKMQWHPEPETKQSPAN